jgi:ABC-type phosphate transport system ATPase subunit
LSLEELEKKEIKKNSYIEDLILELKQLVIAHEIERKFKQTNKKTQELLIMQNEQIVELENSRKIISLEKSPKKSNKIMSLEKCQEEGY